jgi:hypothetical protein
MEPVPEPRPTELPPLPTFRWVGGSTFPPDADTLIIPGLTIVGLPSTTVADYSARNGGELASPESTSATSTIGQPSSLGGS